MFRRIRLGWIFLVLSLCSCNAKKNNQVFVAPDKIGSSAFCAKVKFDYAVQLELYSYENGLYLARIGGSSTAGQTLLIVPKEMDLDFLHEDLADCILLKYPVANVYLAATAVPSLWRHCGLLDAVRYSSVQKKTWLVPEMVQAMEKGLVTFAGKYDSPDYELLLDGKCSLAVESTMLLHNPAVKEKLESLGIPVVVDLSSYENNPLGRMEWVKFYGLLSGCLEQSQKWFEEETTLLHGVMAGTGQSFAGSLTDSETSLMKPSVSFFYISGSSLAVIRRDSDSIAEMIRMAGGSYLFPEKLRSIDLLHSPSVSVGLEDFFTLVSDADYLIYNTNIDSSINSLSALVELNPLFADCKAVKEKHVWSCGKNLYQSADAVSQIVMELNAVLADDKSGDETDLAFEFFERLK